MKYTPPQIINTVDAQTAIQGIGKLSSADEGGTEAHSNVPGYEADE